ncbi:uncharacterized protein B0H18DRAFT_951800 [Fomitopsis serialis]|uniref:uncharacterized protein n=1 Tax=Fomitopsis serialis TaxID=139415 RepID=UPI0020087AE6|nr:uncharacterized protein B0H18DRAFT_951800 [Neoantrodia serialis]KAH9933830.1 hypothetical protein B0H18DRAFT_951800 [Neoantrodia serialis]
MSALDLNPSLGCYYIGIVISLVFFGVTCSQVLFYAKTYRNDNLLMKCWVATLWLLDTITTIFALSILWGETITSHGQPLALLHLDNVFMAEYAFAAITVLLVQCHYIFNIWRCMAHVTSSLLLNSWRAVHQGKTFKIPLTLTALSLALLSFAGALVCVYLGSIHRQIPGAFNYMKNTGFRSTGALIRKLTMYIVNRAILTMVLQTVQFITYISLPNAVQVWAVFHFPGSKGVSVQRMELLLTYGHAQV